MQCEYTHTHTHTTLHTIHYRSMCFTIERETILIAFFGVLARGARRRSHICLPSCISKKQEIKTKTNSANDKKKDKQKPSNRRTYTTHTHTHARTWKQTKHHTSPPICHFIQCTYEKEEKKTLFTNRETYKQLDTNKARNFCEVKERDNKD